MTHTLDQVFTAPAIVKRVLCDEARVHEAYVGSAQAQVRGASASGGGASGRGWG